MSNNNAALNHVKNLTKSKTCERCRQIRVVSPASSSFPSSSPQSQYGSWGSSALQSPLGSPSRFGTSWVSPNHADQLHSILWHKPYLQTADILQHTLTADCDYSGPLHELQLAMETTHFGSPLSVNSALDMDIPMSSHTTSSPLVIRYDPNNQRDTTIRSIY
jgi:hypothetical protein